MASIVVVYVYQPKNKGRLLFSMDITPTNNPITTTCGMARNGHLLCRLGACCPDYDWVVKHIYSSGYMNMYHRSLVVLCTTNAHYYPCFCNGKKIHVTTHINTC